MGLNSLWGSWEIDELEVKNKQREWNHVFMTGNRYSARDENGKHQTRHKSIVKSFPSGNVNRKPLDLLTFYSTLICSVCRFQRIRIKAINKANLMMKMSSKRKAGGYMLHWVFASQRSGTLLCFSALTCLQLHWELFTRNVTDRSCITPTLGCINVHNLDFRVCFCLTAGGMFGKRSLNPLWVNKTWFNPQIKMLLKFRLSFQLQQKNYCLRAMDINNTLYSGEQR